MAFPERLLHDQEVLVLDLRPHWTYYAAPAALLALAVALLVFVAVALDNQYVLIAAGALTIVCLVRFVLRYLGWLTTNFVLTSDRLIYRSGVISKHGIEIPLERVNTVFSSQTAVERLLRKGDLLIESGGERGASKFYDIPRPGDVQNEIYRQIEDNGRRSQTWIAPAPAAPPVAQELSIPRQIDELADLANRGVISSAEFEAKKAELLSRM